MYLISEIKLKIGFLRLGGVENKKRLYTDFAILLKELGDILWKINYKQTIV